MESWKVSREKYTFLFISPKYLLEWKITLIYDISRITGTYDGIPSVPNVASITIVPLVIVESDFHVSSKLFSSLLQHFQFISSSSSDSCYVLELLNLSYYYQVNLLLIGTSFYWIYNSFYYIIMHSYAFLLYHSFMQSVKGAQSFKMFASCQSDHSHSYVDITKNYKESTQALSL